MPKPPRAPGAEALKQPHDALFKWVFSQRKHAKGLLKATLPRELAAVIHWASLRLEKGSYIDEALRSRHSDLVFSTQIRGAPMYIYTLIEQQRDVEALMVFRVGLYMMRLWEQLVREEPTRKDLPPIFPSLIHHSDTGWTAATAFQDIIAGDEAVRAALSRYTPHFEVCLLELSKGQTSGLHMEALTALGKIALWGFSVAGDDARLQREMMHNAEALEEVARAPDGLAAFRVLLRYLVATHERLNEKKVVKLFEKSAGPAAREAVVTVLDKIEQRGERKGERRGRAEGRAELLLLQLTARFGAVAAEVRARVMAAEEKALTQWGLRVLTAATVGEVFSEDSRGAAPPRRPSASKRARRR